MQTRIKDFGELRAVSRNLSFSNSKVGSNSPTACLKERAADILQSFLEQQVGHSC